MGTNANTKRPITANFEIKVLITLDKTTSVKLKYVYYYYYSFYPFYKEDFKAMKPFNP